MEKIDNLHPLTDTVLQRTLHVRHRDCSWKTHIWYTPVYPTTVVHPWKILVHPGVCDTHGWQALLHIYSAASGEFVLLVHRTLYSCYAAIVVLLLGKALSKQR